MIDEPSNLHIRRARENDLPEMARIHQASFPGARMNLQETIAHIRENPRISLEDYWVCERNGRLVGLFALYDFTMHRAGALIPAGGIGSVAVAPESRRAGIAQYMMAQAVEIMDRNSRPLSILYPFRHSFYRQLGWGVVGKVRMYLLSPHSLPDFPERSGVEPVLTQVEREQVMECYTRFARRGNGLIQRPDAQWNERIFKNAVCFAYREPASGKVEGYLTFRYTQYPVEESFVSTEIEVGDFVHNSPGALRGLLGFLSAQRDQVRIIHFPDREELPLEHLLTNPRMPGGRHDWTLGAETGRIGCGLMGRIVNLRRALKAVEPIGDGSGDIVLKVTDDLNPRNSTPLAVEITDGKVAFPKRQKISLTLSTDIATFSSIYWGALQLNEAILLGLAQIEGQGDITFFNHLSAVPRPMCLDFF